MASIFSLPPFLAMVRVFRKCAGVKTWILDELVEQDESTRIFVSGIPEGATCELLQHFFEDTDSNGAGPVKHIELNTIDMTAIVEFENAEAVGIITRREQLSFLGRSLKILKLDPESFLDVKQKQIFCCVLKKLGLHDKYPEKIKVEDVVSLDPNETLTQATTKLTDMPWMFLRRLITSHSEARDQAVVKQEGSGSEDKTVSLLSDEPSDDISPLDICFVVLQCCDPILKQILYQKLYQCKLAVPFLYKDWKNEFLKPTLALWPLRSLTVEYRETFAPSELKVIEANVLELPTKTVAFARYGRPCYSKSKLINSILSNHGCKTFYNIDCPSGMTPRFVSNGNVEIFWLPNIGDKSDKFPDHVTFLNIRGNLQANFKDNIISFLSQIVDTFIIVIDKGELYTYRTQLESLIIKFPSVMFLIDSSLHKQDVKFTETFQQQVTATKPTLKLKFLCTHKGIVEQNVVDIVSTVVHSISDLLTAYKAQSVEFKIRNSTTSFVQSDEDSPSCTKGRQGAEHIHSIMREEAEPDRWKYLVTPIQCFFSKKLGQLLKQRAREKLIDKTDNVEERIKEIRSMMVRKVSKSLKAFATTLVSSNFNDLELEFFLGWLKNFIEREKRIVYRQMMQKYCCACNMLKEMRLNVNNPLQDIERQIDEINKLELQIDNASFSIDHMFRELGHIYDALIESGLHSNQDNLPELERVAQVVGYCVYKGHQFELIDGESCLMPLNWIKRVFDKIAICTGPKKIMALSVVGLQSSGKSTLLNTMFGSQFAARSGRCTKGVHMQLIPLRQGINNFDLLPFQYVVIIDTEGLRSSQLTDLKHEYDHDNEMATVITGLGDITIMNTMGENIFEIRDIFQVVVHAFLRLKLANKKLDITKNCCFVYQNVTDTCAADSLFNGNDRLLNFLDIITQESARSEGILEINTFNHVIEFDIRSDVWYLKHFWQGNQPMAMVNYEYSERVAEIKKQILLKAISMKDKSYKSIDNFITHMRCLWDGVLTDDFVFSFRNSLEIKAYREMENALQNMSWQFEIVVQKELVDVLANNFAGCSQEHELMSISASTETDLVNFLNENLSKTEKKMNEYFETNIYIDIVIQWKQSQILKTLHGKLQKDIKDKINKICCQRSIEILTTENLLKHEDELCKKSMDVANKYKGKYLTTQQKDDLFEDIWKTFLQNVNISSFQLNTSVQGLQMTFIRNLYEICKSDAFLVTQYLHQYKHLTVKPSFDRLSGSFAFSCINDEDVSFSFSRLSKDVFGLRMNSMTHVKKQVEMLFEEYDGRIGRLDQSNDEITEHHILHLLHELQNGIANILKCTNDFVFKKTFYVKMYVHVTNFACHIFNEHNKTYHRVHRAQVRLNKYKQQQQISFEAHLNNRQYEDIVAMLLSNFLDVFVREKSQEPIQISVSKFLYSKLPQNKNQVIISILTKLTEKDEFESFLKYIKNPTGCASLWLAELCNNFLFEKESDENYFTLARNIVRDIFRRVRACVEKSLENHKTKQSSLALDTFIELFNACLKMEKLVVPQENFRTLLSQKGSIDNILFLNNAIMKYIAKAEEKLVQEIKGINKYTVRWCGSNPIDLSIKKVWGCTKQCVFCGEPCAKTDEHTDSDHYSIQHRPLCCKGVFHEGTKLASLESCNFAVQSDISHNCMAFGYLCNSPKPENCSSKEHKFREYKKYVSNWDIPPSSNLYETSQFWLWFVSKYKDQLAKHYEYKVDDIPATWGNIRKEQALKSLSEMYFP